MAMQNAELVATYEFLTGAWRWYKSNFEKEKITEKDWDNLADSSSDLFSQHKNVSSSLKSRVILGLQGDIEERWKARMA